MPIPTEPVGSLPRPAKLQAAYRRLRRRQDQPRRSWRPSRTPPCRDSIKRMEATGSPIISDGEQRWSSFATYPITDTLAGTGLRRTSPPDGQYFAIFADGHHRQLPRLTGGPFRYKTYAADYAREVDHDRDQADEAGGDRARRCSRCSTRSTTRCRATRARSSRRSRRRVREGHPPGVRDRRGARLDRLHRGAARQPQRPAQPVDRRRTCSPHFIELNNRVHRPLHGRGAHEHRHPHLPGRRLRLGPQRRRRPTPTCCRSMFEINAGYFLIQLASERGQGARSTS